MNNLARNQVSAVFHSRVIRRSVSLKFIELCMETPCRCPSEGHKHGGRIVKKKSVSEFCYWNEKLLLQSSDTLKELFLLVQALFSPQWWLIFWPTRTPPRVAIFMSRNAKTCSITITEKNPVELKHCETSSSCRVFYLMNLKPEKER